MGVYAPCDLVGVPVDVGQSTDGIRARVNRHITSARSDVIANRLIDIWELAYVQCWPVSDKMLLGPLECHLFHKFHSQYPLMNGTILPEVNRLDFRVDAPIVVQIMSDEEIADRKRVELRLTRQAAHFGNLLDHFLNVKDSQILYLALQTHFARLQKYFEQLRPEAEPA